MRGTIAMGRARVLAAALLVIALLLLPLAVPAGAAGEGTGTEVTELLATVSGLTPLEEALYRGMMAEEEHIDLTALSPAPTSLEVKAAMQHLINAAPELFHVGMDYTTAQLNGAIVSVSPTYTLAGRELLLARLAYLSRIDEITAGVDPGWSDAEICLYLHDYLCRNFAYDTTYTIYDAYGFLTEGTGVCQSYTLTYIALLTQFGIPVTYATGKDGGASHIWNIVTIDGESYHVDATWGDPLSGGRDSVGTATHDNFLKSDAAIDATGHTERQNHGGVVCGDTRYDNAPFTGAQSSSAFVGGTAYVIDNGRVLALDDDLLTATEIYAVTARWQSGLSYLARRPACVAAYGGLLYVNTPNTILELDPASGHATTILTVKGGLILSLIGNGQTLTYGVSTDISGRGMSYDAHTLPAIQPPCPDGHTMEVYTSVPATCAEEGLIVYRCGACGTRETLPLPPLPHTERVTVVPPSYGTVGYTEAVCTVCGHTERRDEVDALPLPTREEYAAAVRAVCEATDPAAHLDAIRAARELEPYLDPIETAAERTALQAAIEAYDARIAAVNADYGGAIQTALLLDAGLLSSVGAAFAVLFLALRRVLGL